MKRTINLENLIKTDKNSLTNKEGLKPLFTIAELIANNDATYSKSHVQDEILKLNINNLNAEEVNTFLSFIYYSKICNNKILSHLHSFKLDMLRENEEKILIKALIMRFVIERNQSFFSLRQILDEAKVKASQPWIWIDCLSFLNWNLCITEISKLLNLEDGNFKNLLIRIPSFEKRFGKPSLIEAFIKWHSNLNISDRMKLDKWAVKFEIKLGLSISAERLIDNASFLQNQIM